MHQATLEICSLLCRAERSRRERISLYFIYDDMASFRELIQNLGRAREARFQRLAERNGEELSTDERAERGMAPIRNSKLFLMPQGEPFFETVYPILQRFADVQDHPTINLGIAGTRNLSIVGATRANAAVLADLNLSHQVLMDALGHVGKNLSRERGIGNFGPTDFVREFSRHEQAQELLRQIPEDPRAHSTIPTDLAEELSVPESWFFEGQRDGRFQHVMTLFRDDRIATLAINGRISDAPAYAPKTSTLRRYRRRSI
jgi:hypothetical protein